MNPKNKDNKNFQYPVAVGVKHIETPNHPERIGNIEKYSNNYNWKNIKLPAG